MGIPRPLLTLLILHFVFMNKHNYYYNTVLCLTTHLYITGGIQINKYVMTIKTVSEGHSSIYKHRLGIPSRVMVLVCYRV